MKNVKLNIYRAGAIWFVSCFVDGVFDFSDELDVEPGASRDDAMEAALAMRLSHDGERTVVFI